MFNARPPSLVLVAVLLAGPDISNAQEAEDYECSIPGPAQDESWGPTLVWVAGDLAVRIEPFGDVDHQVEVRLFAGDGPRVWSEGIGQQVGDDHLITVPLNLDSLVDGRLASLSVVVEAVSPISGQVLSRKKTRRRLLYNDSVRGLQEVDEVELSALATASDVAPQADLVELPPVGREVTP